MRTDKNPGRAPAQDSTVDTDSDRYPNLVPALRRVIEDERLPEGPFEWLEVHALASGELTYRVRRPRADHAEEVEGGHIPAA